ncbi:1309_t:CDS:10 [Entrophospora sp. SA101]|nr:1309_t:CDS:10 [Entrophospora sp. SA101]
MASTHTSKRDCLKNIHASKIAKIKWHLINTKSSTNLTRTPMPIDANINPAFAVNEVSQGAGIVGCSAAVAFERDMKEPDRIVGELLQPGGVAALEKLGLRDCLENIDAIPCHGYGIFYQDDNVHVPYPILGNGKQASGKSFHHGRFIMNLRKAASETSNVTIFEGTANELIQCPITDRVLGVICTQKVQNGDSNNIIKQFFAPLTIVADGCFSKFRKYFVPREPTVKSNFVGFIMKDAELPFPNHGTVLLGNIAPILMYQIGTHDTRVLIDIPGKLPSNGSALQKERLRSMPNSFLPPSANINSGLIMLGDAMNMRHPLTGGSGMTVGFNDVVLLSKLLSPTIVPDFNEIGLVLAQMQAFHWERKFHCNENLRILREACFNYFHLGGICVEGPCSLLSGLTPNPLVLIFHFFAVAVFGTWRIISNGHITQFPQNIIKSIMVIYTACIVIIPILYTEIRF